MGQAHQPQPSFQHQQAPLTTHWNPQLDLFLGAPPSRPADGGPLWQAEWQRQERRLARNHSSASWRRMAADSDRRRPGPEQRPKNAHYDWAWPSFTGLALDTGFVRAPSPRFALTGLQLAEQEQALAELLCEIAQHIAFALSRPCPVYENEHQLRVEFLGCIAWVANGARRRALHLELRDRDGRWQLSPGGFDVERALGDGDWLAQALLPWLPQIEARFGSGAGEAYRRLREKLALHFRERRFLEATERQVYHCMACSRSMARLLRTLKPHRAPRFPTSFLYTQLAMREEIWTHLERRAPGLVVLYYVALSQKRLRPGDGVGALRDFCFKLGLNRTGWRFLCRFGLWAYEGMLNPDQDFPPSLEIAVAWVQWQAAAGLEQPLPAAFAESALAAGAFAWPEQDKHVSVLVDPRLGRIVEDHLPGPQGRGREPIDIEEWEDVLEWWALHQPELDRNQWQAGWPAIRRAYQRWLRQAMNEPWDCPLDTAHRGDWVVRPLLCGRDLLAEGERMRHCAANYLSECLEGTQRFFTIEKNGTGKPVATFDLRLKDGQWRIGDVRGKRNARPDSDMWGLATVTCNSYNRAVAGQL